MNLYQILFYFIISQFCFKSCHDNLWSCIKSKLLPSQTIFIKYIEKKLDGNCTRKLRAILNKSWKQHSMKQEAFSHLPPIFKTTQNHRRRTRHSGHCCRSKVEPINDALQETSSHGRASVGRPTRTYLCGHRVYFGKPTGSDWCLEPMERQSQGSLY